MCKTGGTQRTTGKYRPVICFVADFHTLGITKENNRMLTSHITAAQNGKADIPLFACARLAFANHVGHRIQINPAAACCRLSKRQRRARGCIHLVMVVRFKNFDIPPINKLRSHLFNKAR